ncbi:MAG: alkaline phosphatase [Tidjanibacter sp.]|nr:alkaline phosphatase [Tidjanibacter sp.]
MRKSIGTLLILAATLCSLTTLSAEEPKVRNIIFMIGDGMGVSQVTTAMVKQNYEPLAMERAEAIGLTKTYSANNRVTDSAASGTALATGVKTYNGAIGVNPDKEPVASTREKAQNAGYATGIVVTYPVTNATPAAFVGHVENRSMEEEIAAQYLDYQPDVIMGGGSKFFNERKDRRNLIQQMIRNGYKVGYKLSDLDKTHSGKVAMFGAAGSLPTMVEGRGDYLPQATAKALDILTANTQGKSEGFFLMVEGSMIDGFAHKNNADGMVAEILDFDAAVKVAFDYADTHPGTLVVVTADHETGGLTIVNGNKSFDPKDQTVEYNFSTTGHSGGMIPVYAYGSCASEFGHVMENTDVALIMQHLLGL